MPEVTKADEVREILRTSELLSLKHKKYSVILGFCLVILAVIGIISGIIFIRHDIAVGLPVATIGIEFGYMAFMIFFCVVSVIHLVEELTGYVKRLVSLQIDESNR